MSNITDQTDRHVSPVAADVLARLASRLGSQWAAGQRLPSVRRLAKAFGAAPNTVVRALDRLKAEGLLVARPRLGIYVTHRMTDAQMIEAVERLQTSDTGPRPLDGRRIQLIYRRSGEELIGRMIESLTDELTRLGAALGHQAVTTREKITAIRTDDPDADAMVVLNPDRVPIECPTDQMLLIITTAGQVMVRNTNRYDVVQVEQEHGGQLAGQRLREAGCRRACFLGVHVKPGQLSEASAARRSGFIAGWGDDDIDTLTTHAYGITPGAHLVSQYMTLDPRPDAIFAASDELAMGFFWGAAGHGLDAKRNYQLIGFDGQSRGQTLPGIPLTTIAVPAETMGRRGAHQLVSRILDPDQPVRRLALGCELMEGRTA